MFDTGGAGQTNRAIVGQCLGRAKGTLLGNGSQFSACAHYLVLSGFRPNPLPSREAPRSASPTDDLSAEFRLVARTPPDSPGTVSSGTGLYATVKYSPKAVAVDSKGRTSMPIAAAIEQGIESADQ